MVAAAGLSELLRGCLKAGPAGLRGLPRSPPHRAGQASATLRGSFVNPCRGRRWGGCGAVFSNSLLDFCLDFFNRGACFELFHSNGQPASELPIGVAPNFMGFRMLYSQYQ